jgi:hypothetical protein
MFRRLYDSDGIGKIGNEHGSEKPKVEFVQICVTSIRRAVIIVAVAVALLALLPGTFQPSFQSCFSSKEAPD